MAAKKPFIKLLFFSPYFYPYISGLTQYPYRLFTESSLPIETTCLTFKHTEDLEEKSIILSEAKNLVIFRMPFLFRISKGFISPQSISYFWNETKKNEIVIINLPNFEGLLLAIVALLQNKPLITLLHCEVLLPFSLQNVIVNFFLNCSVYIQLIFSKKIIVYTKDYYKNKWIYSFLRNKMEFIFPPIHSNPIDEKYLEELKEMKKKYTYVIGFCGRIAAEKGIEVLIESVLHLKDTIIFFAGPTGKDVVGEEKYYSKIHYLLEQKKIPHLFLGTLSAGKLSSFYKLIDVLVLPSLNKTEAFGMVQVEAMLQGTPVVASNLPGVRVPIQLTKMGILTIPNNSSEVTNAIKTIIKNKSLYTNPLLIHKAKEIFDSKKTYDSIYSILLSVS